MSLTIEDILDEIKSAAKPNLVSTLEKGIASGLAANQLLETEGRKQEGYRKYFKEKGITGIKGFYDIPDDAQDAEVNAILSKYSGRLRNRKLLVFDNGKAFEFYDRTPGQDIEYSGKEPGAARISGKFLEYNVDPDRLDLEVPNLEAMGLVAGKPQGVESDSFIDSIVEAVKGSEGAQPVVPTSNNPGVDAPTGADELRQWVSDNIMPALFDVPGGPQTGDTQPQSQPQAQPQPEININQIQELLSTIQGVQPGIESILGAGTNPAESNRLLSGVPELIPNPATPVTPTALEAPVTSNPDELIAQLVNPLDLGLVNAPLDPQQTELNSQLSFASDPLTLEGSGEIADYLDALGGAIPSFGNQGTPGVKQITTTGGTAGGGPGANTPPTTDNPYAEWQEGQRKLSDLYAQKAEQEGVLAEELSNEFDSLMDSRQAISGLVGNGLDEAQTQVAIGNIDQRIQTLQQTAQSRAVAGMADIQAQIARQEGVVTALKPQADKALREQSLSGDVSVGLLQAAKAMFPGGISQKDIAGMSLPQKQGILVQKEQWDNTPYSQQLYDNPTTQENNDRAYIRYKELQGATIDEDIYNDITLVKRLSMQQTYEDKDLQKEILSIHASGAPKESAFSREQALRESAARQLLQTNMEDRQGELVQTNKRYQNWLIDPAYPSTQAVVEQLPLADRATSINQFVDSLWKIAEQVTGSTEAAEETVLRMLSRYDQQWGVNYAPAGIPSYSQAWFHSWKSHRERSRIEQEREKKRISSINERARFQ